MFREAREKLGLTQVQLAKELGMGGQQVSNMEREVAPVPAKYWKRLSLVLRIPLSEIESYCVERYLNRQRRYMRMKRRK